MRKKILWITRTGVLLALLVTLQVLTKGFGQLATGSFVNAVLAVAALAGGFGCGITVALISPVLAYLLGIAPQILTVPVIMVGNALYVLLLHLVTGKNNRIPGKILGLLAAAAGKFAALYGLVTWGICGLLAQPLLESGLLKAPMLQALPATFSWPQLFTALVGGGVALAITPVLRKAVK